MEFKYVVHYLSDSIGGEVGCTTLPQAKKIAEAIVLSNKLTNEQDTEISIQNVETGNVEPFYY